MARSPSLALSAWANVSLAESLLHSGAQWYLAGLAGTVLSAVWNYSVSNLFTWQMPQTSRQSEAEVPETALPSAKPMPFPEP